MANKREVLTEITDSFFKSIYRKATPKANKFLLSDGAIVDEEGNEIEKSEFWKKKYKEAEPIPLKYLHSDGSVDEIGGGGITPVTEPVIEVDKNTTLNNIQADTKVIIEGENITLTLGNAGKGIIVTLLATTDPANIVFNTTSEDTTIQDVLQAGEVAKLVYIGERWEIIQEVGQITNNDSELKPFGTLLMIGEAHNKVKYPRLFNFVGTKHNQDGDSEDTFRLPDLRNRTIMGANPDVSGKADGNTSNVGDVQKASVPNITASSVVVGSNSDGGSGAIKTTVRGNSWDTSGNAVTIQFNNSLFDASASNGNVQASTDHLGDNVFANADQELRSANIRMNYLIKY